MRLHHVKFTALLFIAAITASAAPPDNSTAFRRADLLKRGINLSAWFQGGDVSPAHIARTITPADLKFIKDSGLTCVRIGVDPTQLTQSGGFNSYDSRAALNRLDNAVNQALAANLAVTITIFPTDDYKRGLAGQNGVDQFLFLWRQLAQHYATADPDHIFFELINEPEIIDPYRWDGIQAAAISAIRSADKTHTIIATASFYSGLPELLKVQPVRDANIIYNFHFYEPMAFTHQGASWGSFEWNYFKDVPYPATAETLQAALATVPDESARYTLYLYGATGWNRAAILGRLQFARAWADQQHVPIICNEFGAYRETVPGDSRIRYLRDVRTSMEQLNIGWAMWEYTGGFGLIRRAPDGHIVPDAPTVEALGLTPARP